MALHRKSARRIIELFDELLADAHKLATTAASGVVRFMCNAHMGAVLAVSVPIWAVAFSL
jgi:hypothetical protein